MPRIRWLATLATAAPATGGGTDPPEVAGGEVDEATRCAHHGTAKDIVAFRFRCCGDWYACRACHDEATDHDTQTWGPGDLDTHAVLCGRCGSTMSIDTYVACAHACPFCGAGFNPNCRGHWELYFDAGEPRHDVS